MKSIHRLIALVLLLCAAAPAAAIAANADTTLQHPPSFANLAKMAASSVVNIYVAKQARVQAPHFIMPFQVPPQRGQGSGFIVDAEGLIVTNNHVVQGSDEIRVRLMDKREFNAKIIGTDPKTDLALLKIDAKDLPHLKFGDSDALQVGDWVIAIGNPFGLSHTVTAGIVSAKGRSLGAGPYEDYIQTDASINPGNSGGPLLNTDGEVVGINSLITASGQGIGFAIPSNLATTIIRQLQDHGSVTRSWLGIYFQPMTPELAESFGLERPIGALVNQVIEGGPAQKAGLKSGDIIVEFNGKPVEESSELPLSVATIPAGKKVTVKFIRDKKPQTVTLELAEMPDNATRLSNVPNGEGPDRDAVAVMIFGMELADLTPDVAATLGVPAGKGILIKEVQPFGEAAAAGLAAGDVILAVNRASVNQVRDFMLLVKKLPNGTRLLFFVQRGQNTFYVPLAR
ncbi:MAG: Do family serine endopeptidase [Myxococcales bacterium]|nr:Do family serine endopeptidase [Myxococcales bacterium]